MSSVVLICTCFFHLKEDEKFLTEVFAQLTDEGTDDSKRRELVRASYWTAALLLTLSSRFEY